MMRDKNGSHIKLGALTDIKIKLPYENRTFHIVSLIRYLRKVGRNYIVIGANFCVFEEHKKPNSLDYWIRKNIAKYPDTCNAINELVAEISNTELFIIKNKLICPDTGRRCKGIQLVDPF